MTCFIHLFTTSSPPLCITEIVWILTRDRNPDDETVKKATAVIRRGGFPNHTFIRTNQKNCPEINKKKKGKQWCPTVSNYLLLTHRSNLLFENTLNVLRTKGVRVLILNTRRVVSLYLWKFLVPMIYSCRAANKNPQVRMRNCLASDIILDQVKAVRISPECFCFLIWKIEGMPRCVPWDVVLVTDLHRSGLNFRRVERQHATNWFPTNGFFFWENEFFVLIKGRNSPSVFQYFQPIERKWKIGQDISMTDYLQSNCGDGGQ